MKEVKAITPLSFGAIACNATLICLICYSVNFSYRSDVISFLIIGPGLFFSLLYAVQLILMKRSYYRHYAITTSAKVFLHICRIITLLYSLMGIFLLAVTFYNSFRNRAYLSSHDYKFMASLALVLVTVVMDLTIFFKGWRLLKLVKTPYIEGVIASFD
jgi:hypothetical protein